MYNDGAVTMEIITLQRSQMKLHHMYRRKKCGVVVMSMI